MTRKNPPASRPDSRKGKPDDEKSGSKAAPKPATRARKPIDPTLETVTTERIWELYRKARRAVSTLRAAGESRGRR